MVFEFFYLLLILLKLVKAVNSRNYSPHGGPLHLSTILIKDSHVFKIVKSVFSFYLKLYNFKQVRIFY